MNVVLPSQGPVSIEGQSPGLARETIEVVVTLPTFKRPAQVLETLGSLRRQETGRRFAVILIENEAEVEAAIRRAGPFDGYVLNSVQFAGAFEDLVAARPSIFVAHNVEHLSAHENAEAARDLPERLLYRRESRLLKALEERLCRRARFVFTLAEEDRAALGVGSDERSAVLALTTRPEAPVRHKRRIECDAALIGTWTWQPNRIGLDWFLDRVVPHLRPDFRIRIAGSGVQLKTIETFELGLPSVATSRSLRGIGYRPENCVVADDPTAFAAALEAAVAGRPADADGASFHRHQIRALDRAIGRGLAMLEPARQEIPA